MSTPLVGHVEEYPCDCAGEGSTTCWIVRHPKLTPSVSFPTRTEAESELKELNK